MGQSTNAVLAYGWAFGEEFDHYAEQGVWDELEPKLKKLGVALESHCSGECPMPALIIAKSQTTAHRGYPEKISKLEARPDWDGMLQRGMMLIKQAYKDAKYPPEFLKTKDTPSWVLYSMWN